LRRSKRIDKIRSVKSVFLALFLIALLFAVSELILREFSSFGDTLNNVEYYASIAFTEEERQTAIKAREDFASIGERLVGVPGTAIFHYKKVRTDSFNFNSFGFRGEEPQKKEENEYRIGVVGDSRILGILFVEENTIPFVMQKRLQEEFPDKKITVFNMGIEGYDLKRAAPFAELNAEKLELDMSVFYSTIVDINNSFLRGNDDYKPFKPNESVGEVMIENIEGNRRRPLFQRSAVMKVITETFYNDSIQKSGSFEKDADFVPLIPEFEARADDLLFKFKSLAKKTSDNLGEKGIKSVFFTPPLLQMKDPLSPAEYKILYRNEVALPGLNSYFLHFEKGISEGEDPVFFKQSYLFKGYSETMFYDGIHYIPKSAKLVGNNMAERVIPLIKESFKK
jgi:hypothetical protein